MALQLFSVEKWKHYLNEIGIPNPHAEEYAITFNKHQVPHSLLRIITDEELRETYEIEIGGHRLLIRHNNTAASTASPSNVTQASRPLVRHQSPQLQPTMSPSSFRAFASHWAVYKTLVGITSSGPDTAAQLFSLACNDHPDLRRTIAEHRSDHLMLPESEYLDMLKRLLTAQATPETYQNKFFGMVQNAGESCQQWLKRLQEVTPDCEFVIPCDQHDSITHSFENTLLRSKFILGTYNPGIKQELLTRSAELITLDQVFNHATRMEATSRDMEATSKLVAGMAIDSEPTLSSEEEEVAKLSSYRKMKRPVKPQRKQQPKKCTGCGSSQHSNFDRATKCPAWGRNCNNCGKRGHFSSVCRGDKPTDSANALLASISTDSKICGDHIEAHITLLCNSGKSNKIGKFMVLPDTGATICVAGSHVLKTLGVKPSQLRPTERSIRTASGNALKCKGWIPVKISINGRSTQQDLFICERIQKFFLSKTGCTK